MPGLPPALIDAEPCRGCEALDRREFLHRSLLVAAAGFLAGCAGGVTSSSLTPTTIRVADYPSLATVGGIAVIDTGRTSGTPIALARTGDATFVALSLICPHRGSTVQSLGTSFQCPTHGATFSADGTWTGGQRTSSLSRYSVVYDAAAGTVVVS